MLQNCYIYLNYMNPLLNFYFTAILITKGMIVHVKQSFCFYSSNHDDRPSYRRRQNRTSGA